MRIGTRLETLYVYALCKKKKKWKQQKWEKDIAHGCNN